MNPATNLAPKLAQLYPGVYNPDGPLDGDVDAANKLPTKPLNTLLGFELQNYQIPLAQVLASNTNAAPLDVDQVNALIDQKVSHLNSPPPTQVNIVTPDVTRTLNGLHHDMLPKLIRVVATGLNVWISGPTGGGKSHAIEQVAEALSLPFYLQGSMGMAHELIGFRDANGDD